ncbi:hypothetical protein L596_017740 [Steinernema carpocapsae]|uniref:Uncharacterized protein n=1 Tax=Steinernema carpocapsae TaxID=34508 RepID=A0A4U5N2J5_STECR|nr:hypothetical protein L596_017740 [Steinernema carpocapsae]
MADLQPKIDQEVFCLLIDRRINWLTNPIDQLRHLQEITKFFKKVEDESASFRYQLFDLVFLGREGESFLHESRMQVLCKLCVHMLQFGPYNFYADVAQWLNRISSGGKSNYARLFVEEMTQAYLAGAEQYAMHEYLIPLREHAVEFTVYFLIFAIQQHTPGLPWAVVFTEWLKDDCAPFFGVVKENNFLAKEFASQSFNLILRHIFCNDLDEELAKSYDAVVRNMCQSWKRSVGAPLNMSCMLEILETEKDVFEEEHAEKFLCFFVEAVHTKSISAADFKRILDAMPEDLKKAVPRDVIENITGLK